jgi:hypothetical protein
MVKSFEEFLLEAEEKEENTSAEPETKEITIGETNDGRKVRALLKLGNTLELTGDDFRKLMNMRVSQSERDMLTHMRGAKEYKISKGKDKKYTIFHNNQTLHKLEAVGVFYIHKKS